MVAGQEPVEGRARTGGIWLSLEPNLSSLWTKRPKCRHQPFQDPPRSLCIVSIVSSGMQQEHHIHRAMGTRCTKEPSY